MSGAYRRAMGSKRSNVPAVVGLVLLVGGFGSIPLLVRKSNENHNLLTSEKPLTGSQIQRGMYLNTGSQDAGPDPDWDMERRVYKGSSLRNFDDETLKLLRPEER